MSIPEATLDHKNIQTWFCNHHGVERWTVLYQRGHMGTTSVGLYSYIIDPTKTGTFLEDPGWDLSFGDGGPGFSQAWRGDRETVTYHRWCSLDGIEPLAIVRYFYHGRPSYVEISEELRLLFNLFEDRQTGSFFEMEEDGTETEVIRISAERAEIRTSFLRRYLAARQMALVLQIAADWWQETLPGLPQPMLPTERRNVAANYCFEFYSATVSPGRVFSRFLGKKILLPPDRAECGIRPFKQPKEFLEFIIDEDGRGRPIEHTCNPDQLSNHFGANPGAPNYLTPVFFDREVLRKYYENNDRYLVGDGDIRCGGLWILRVDNNHPDHVAVFLGDLGRDIPTSEQRHWRNHNIMPEERILSETAFRRAILGQFTDADLEEHQFRYAYTEINSAWDRAFGWPLFRDLHPDDRHVLDSLRLPLSSTSREFDSQVLNLAKLLVDSLNEECIARELSEAIGKEERGIAKFERLLSNFRYPFLSRDMSLLRTIQGIRSRGVAHRKSNDYDLARAGLDPTDLRQSFKQLLERAVTMLQSLDSFAKSRPSENDV